MTFNQLCTATITSLWGPGDSAGRYRCHHVTDGQHWWPEEGL